MGAVDRATWRPTVLSFEHVSGISYRVERERSGRYACEVREWPGGCWGVFAEGFESAAEAVSACERDMNARMGGGV